MDKHLPNFSTIHLMLYPFRLTLTVMYMPRLTIISDR